MRTRAIQVTGIGYYREDGIILRWPRSARVVVRIAEITLIYEDKMPKQDDPDHLQDVTIISLRGRDYLLISSDPLNAVREQLLIG